VSTERVQFLRTPLTNLQTSATEGVIYGVLTIPYQPLQIGILWRANRCACIIEQLRIIIWAISGFAA
jgi:hypothetical protein